MNIDQLKKEFKKMRAPQMNLTISNKNGETLKNLIGKIRSQDREDELYLIKMKLIPLLIGLIILTVVVMLVPIQNAVLFSGCFIVFAVMVISIILYCIDYINISRESFDLSLLDFLKRKEQRLYSWSSTPMKYKFVFAVLGVGVLLMILGNTRFVHDLGTAGVVVYILVNLILLFLAWVSGEHFYRKRHREKYKPLLKMITEIRTELEKE